MRRGRGAGLVLLALSVAPAALADTTGATALRDATDPILVSCAMPAKAALPAEGMCALFTRRLAAALPGRDVRLAADPAKATARLEVLAAFPGRVEARISLAGADPGPAHGTARAGAGLDEAALSAFFDDLIALSLPP